MRYFFFLAASLATTAAEGEYPTNLNTIVNEAKNPNIRMNTIKSNNAGFASAIWIFTFLPWWKVYAFNE